MNAHVSSCRPQPSFRVVEAGQRVHERVGVRRNTMAEMLEIIADIGDDSRLFPAARPGSSPAQAWRHRCRRRAPTTRSRPIETDPRRGSRGLAAVDPARRPGGKASRMTTTGAASSACPITSEAAAAISSAKPLTLISSSGRTGRAVRANQSAQEAGVLDRDARCSLTPRTSEAVVYHHREIDPPVAAASPRAQRRRAAVRMLRQQKRRAERRPPAPHSIWSTPAFAMMNPSL